MSQRHNRRTVRLLSSFFYHFFDREANAQKYLNCEDAKGHEDHKFADGAKWRLVDYHHQSAEKDRETAKGKYYRENLFQLFLCLWRGGSVGEESERDLCVNIDRKLDRAFEDYLEKYFKQ